MRICLQHITQPIRAYHIRTKTHIANTIPLQTATHQQDKSLPLFTHPSEQSRTLKQTILNCTYERSEQRRLQVLQRVPIQRMNVRQLTKLTKPGLPRRMTNLYWVGGMSRKALNITILAKLPNTVWEM